MAIKDKMIAVLGGNQPANGMGRLDMDSNMNDDTSSEANIFAQKFDDVFLRTSNAVQNLLSQNRPDEALEKFMLFVGTANLYAQIKTSIINKLISIIGQLKMLLKNIAAQINAASYSISVTAPIGLSVSITWDV